MREDWERGARLYGAAEAQTLRTGIRRDPADEAFLQPMARGARAALGETGFKPAEASGRALHFEQAIADVRAWLSTGDEGDRQGRRRPSARTAAQLISQGSFVTQKLLLVRWTVSA